MENQTQNQKKKRDLTKDTLVLRNPVKIDGKDVTELTYDSNEINGVLFATAESKRRAAEGASKMVSLAAEFDYSLHLYMGFAAIVAVNPSYDFADLERIKGHDVVEIMGIGRNFMLASEKAQPENASDEPTETTPESTTQAPATSKKNE